MIFCSPFAQEPHVRMQHWILESSPHLALHSKQKTNQLFAESCEYVVVFSRGRCFYIGSFCLEMEHKRSNITLASPLRFSVCKLGCTNILIIKLCVKLYPSMKNAFCASAVSNTVFHKVANSALLIAFSECSASCVLMVAMFSVRNSARSCDR